MFHRWLFRKGRPLNALTAKEVHDFAAAPRGRAVEQMTRNDYRYKVRRYLRWLEKRGLAGPLSGAEDLDGYHRMPLPDEVHQFIHSFAPTRRPSTNNGYRYVLRGFIAGLATRTSPSPNLNHSVCLAWSQELHERGIPSHDSFLLAGQPSYVSRLAVGTQLDGAAPGRALVSVPATCRRSPTICHVQPERRV